ncbi:MAG: hypothetical protein M1594_01285 [Candidatus Marsarchaeota archaeon]|nr:hypothetical protein [Candidatus Marsarchaeota archaeon]
MNILKITIGVFGLAALLIALYFLFFSNTQNQPAGAVVVSNASKPMPPTMPSGQVTLPTSSYTQLNFNFPGEQLQVKNYYVKLVNYTNNTAFLQLLDSNSQVLGSQNLTLNKTFTTPYYTAVLESVSNGSVSIGVEINGLA